MENNNSNGTQMGGSSKSLHELQLDLENVQSHIQLTKENTDALNARFSKFNPSPKIYLDEYQELTSKLHEFKNMEQNLIEQIQLILEQNEVRLNIFTKSLWSFLQGTLHW